jgi:two-component system LytT family response regulator/two-component system response regulator LytT
VADDEAPALDELLFLLKEFPDLEVVGTAANGLEAVEQIEALEPDLVFLDVQMPGLDGLGVIQRLQQAGGPLPAFVLCTAYEQYALEAFRFEALDYLLKPVEHHRLELTVERVRRALLDPETATPGANTSAAPAPALEPALRKLVLKSGGRNLVVDASDVIYATIEGGLISVVTTQLEGKAHCKTLDELQAALDPGAFWRAHRAFVVNVHHIREVIPWFKSSYQIRMDDKKAAVIPVSRVQTKRLRELFRL